MTQLDRCVGDSARFLTDRWGKRANLRRGSGLAGLLSLEDADAILSSMALRAPAFRVVRDGVTLDQASYTRRARIGSRTVTDLIDVGRVYDHFASGATIVLQGLHRYWKPVTELCRDLEEELTHPLQANAYITPPVARGLGTHADRHDVFAVQTHGRKHWVVYEAPAGEPTLDVELQPDDCLYIPRGVRHAARTVDSPSIHLTVGVHAITWAHVLDRIVSRASTDPLLDEPLPAGFARDPGALGAEATGRLEVLLASLRGADCGEAVAEVARGFWTGRAPALRGQLLELLATHEVDDGTPVRRRPHSTCALERDADRLEVILADRKLEMPAAAEPALRRVIDLGELKAADLGDLLDEAGRVTLIRRLVQEGLLMVAHG